ncbi:MAG TPA: CHASE2 domain-containing protein [Gammaproteobacteria bacterium]|nr:CHASE2 domain-containing protein [Gammaproteobacteria bacterium]
MDSFKSAHSPLNKRRPSGLNYRYSAPILLLVALLAVTWLGTTGTIQLYTGWLYDTLVRHVPFERTAKSRILLIQSKTSTPDPAEWPQLISRLYELGAERVAFAFTPAPLSSELLAVIRNHPGMVFAREPIRNAVTGSIIGLKPWPEGMKEAGAEASILVMPPDELGIRRHQQRYVEVDGQSVATLAYALSRPDRPDDGNTEAFLVNFLDGGLGVPIVNLEWALSDNLVRSLVANRIVMIGFAQNVRETGLHTPATGSQQSVSLLQYSAQALDTLLANDAIHELPVVARLLLYLLIVAVFLYLYQSMSVKTGVWLTLAMILSYVVIAWLLLGLAGYWLPVVEMTILQCVTFGAVFVRKASREEQLIHRTLLDTTAKLRDRVIPASFFASEEPWVYIANLLNQTLELQRLIFLEKVEGDHRVREVHSLNCGLDDIHEMRRDYHRTPYSTAIATNAPVRVERDYLKHIDDEEVQYLVPLTFAGEVLGFWAFGIHPEKITHEESFISLAGDFAEQIAEMLYHRQRWQEEQQREKNRVSRYLRVEGWDETHRSFNNALALLDRRLDVLERVFDGMGNAAILYDLFGRVLQVNLQMETLMKRAGLRFFDMTAIDMISAISGRDLRTVREYMHYIVVERTVISLPAPAIDNDRYTYMLMIRPLIQKQQSLYETDSDLTPFQLGGILIELVDISTFKTLNDLQVNLIDQLNVHLRDDLEALVLATDLLNNNKGGEDQQWVGDIITSKADHAIRIFEDVQKYLYFTFEDASLECYPIDALKPLASSVGELSDMAGKAGIELCTEQPELLYFVMAAPQSLVEVFNDVIRVLIHDASSGSKILIRVTSTEGRVCYHFENTGFGLPPERLHEYLHGDLSVSVDEFRGLRTANRRVQSWGGVFSAETELGKGMSFDICLKGFL